MRDRLITLVGLGILATTTGILVGQSGVDATVLAAVLPVVIAGGGCAALGISFIRTAQNGRPLWLPRDIRPAAAIGVSVFSVMLLVGTYVGGLYKIWTQSVTYKEANLLWGESFTLRIDRLHQCTEEQVRINGIRTELELPPLPIHVVCPDFPPHDERGPRQPQGKNPRDQVDRGGNSGDPSPALGE